MHNIVQRPLDLISVVQSRKSSKDKFKELLNRVVQGEADMNACGEHGNTALHHAVLVRQSIKISFLQHLILPSNVYVFFFFFSFAIVFWVRKKWCMQEQLNTKCVRVLTCCDVVMLHYPSASACYPVETSLGIYWWWYMCWRAYLSVLLRVWVCTHVVCVLYTVWCVLLWQPWLLSMVTIVYTQPHTSTSVRELLWQRLGLSKTAQQYLVARKFVL